MCSVLYRVPQLYTVISTCKCRVLAGVLGLAGLTLGLVVMHYLQFFLLIATFLFYLDLCFVLYTFTSSLVVSTSAVDCVERCISEVTCVWQAGCQNDVLSASFLLQFPLLSTA